jgi:hypothetical protein
MLQPGKSVSLYSGARIDFAQPRKESFFLCDLAECLSRTDSAFADSGIFSLAQRAVILAEHAAKEEGALAACYALLADAGIALMRSVSPFALQMDSNGSLRRSYDNLMMVAHDAVDLDWPCPAGISKPLEAINERLQLRELITLRHNVEAEILLLRARPVVPLGTHLAPIPRDKAWAKWIGTWKTMATAAQLPRTAAWKGMA